MHKSNKREKKIHELKQPNHNRQTPIELIQLLIVTKRKFEIYVTKD